MSKVTSGSVSAGFKEVSEECHAMDVDTFFTALANGAQNCLSIAVACGIAGIIAGVVTMTGLGQIFISAIVGVAGNKLIIALLLTMVTCIILGMGVPTTANYVIMATTCAPILTTGMGMSAMAANMFVFYFGIVADITPPVARRLGHRQVPPHEDGAQRHPIGHSRLPGALHLRPQPSHALYRHGVV